MSLGAGGSGSPVRGTQDTVQNKHEWINGLQWVVIRGSQVQLPTSWQSVKNSPKKLNLIEYHTLPDHGHSLGTRTVEKKDRNHRDFPPGAMYIHLSLWTRKFKAACEAYLRMLWITIIKPDIVLDPWLHDSQWSARYHVSVSLLFSISNSPCFFITPSRSRYRIS